MKIIQEFLCYRYKLRFLIKDSNFIGLLVNDLSFAFVRIEGILKVCLHVKLCLARYVNS